VTVCGGDSGVNYGSVNALCVFMETNVLKMALGLIVFFSLI